MENDIKFQALYGGKTYTFAYGSEAYIFHTGIYNDVDKQYSMKTLLRYVSLVHECYLIDDNRTPLGALADYAAENWKRVRYLGKRELLDRFYQENY
jgi:hypothetical protein